MFDVFVEAIGLGLDFDSDDMRLHHEYIMKSADLNPLYLDGHKNMDGSTKSMIFPTRTLNKIMRWTLSPKASN